MTNSNEKANNKLPDLDYSKLPKDIEEAVSPEPYKIEAEGKLTFDGRQFIIRIPKEIAQEGHVTNNTRVKFSFVKSLPKENREANPHDVKIELI